MNIDAVFIPCAGFGTRMGRVGEVVPKPLWTINGLTLLDLKINQLKRLGFKKFIINTHHQAQKLEKYVESREETIIISHEPEILGNGGSFHQIKKNFPKLKKILVTNPDTFYFLEDSDWSEFFEASKKSQNVLFGVACKEGDSYNRLIISNGLFKRVEVFTGKSKNLMTYGGLSIIDQGSFPFKEGPSSFFETVVNESINQTTVVTPKKPYEFWDFGTLEEFKSLRKKFSIQNNFQLANLWGESFDKDSKKFISNDETIIDIYGEGQKYTI